MFGKGAKLDVQGGFHASTANTLRLGDDGEFNVSNVEQSILTVAAPSAFGFLKAKPAAITLQDSQLAVPTGKSLSLIGGDLSISSSLPPTVDESGEPIFRSTLSAQSGRFNLASVASSGEVIPKKSGLNLSTETKLGPITINNMRLDLSGEGGGNIFIRGGRFELINSSIMGDTIGNQNGGVIDIQVEQLKLQHSIIDGNTKSLGKASSIILKVDDTLELTDTSGIYNSSQGNEANAGSAGNIEIKARQIKLSDGAQIFNGTFGAGEGGSIIIMTADLSLDFGGILVSSEEGATGNAGNIEIEAHQLTLMKGGQINASTRSAGKGGSIYIKDAENLNLSGPGKNGPTGIFSNSEGMEATGQAGNIDIETRQLQLSDGAEISSSTTGTGDGGYITILVTNALNIQQSASIFSISKGEQAHAGKAGEIKIEAHQLTLTEGGNINVATKSTGKGGAIFIKVAEGLTISGYGEFKGHILLSGIWSFSRSSEADAGQAGNIKIEARQLTLKEGGIINSGTFGPGKGGAIIIVITDALTLQSLSYISANSQGKQAHAGQAGEIEITARQLKLLNGAQIGSGTGGTGEGNSIIIIVDEALTISGRDKNGNNSGIWSSSASNKANAGNAGTISVTANTIDLKDGGVIATSANNASGGNIEITNSNLLHLQAGAITTDVKNGQGNGGEIHIHKPVLAILNNSEILTKADQGWGGGIDITADKFIPSADSLLDASSRVEGRSGEIKIEADSYVGNGLITLPESFSDPPSLRRCETQFATQETPSHFTRANRARMRRDELKEGVWGSPLDF
jgi:large exoprotein involved in heme utilization and adhesion